MAVLGLHFCARAFSSCGKLGPLLIAVRGPPTIAASPVAEHRLQTRRPSNCGSWAQPLRGTWDPPRPGLEPVSPAPAGRPPTTAPPGKPRMFHFNCISLDICEYDIFHIFINYMYFSFCELSIKYFPPFICWGIPVLGHFICLVEKFMAVILCNVY